VQNIYLITLYEYIFISNTGLTATKDNLIIASLFKSNYGNVTCSDAPNIWF